MQVWLAYAYDRPVAMEQQRESLQRTVEHYASVAAVPWAEQRWSFGSHTGHAMFETQGSGSRWPVWSDRKSVSVATGYVPLGWEGVIPTSTKEPERPLRLAEQLDRQPSALADLTPPFFLSRRDGERLDIWTDGLGFGRVLELRVEQGWIWSNRLSALFLFAGRQARVSSGAWHFLATCGWFMGDTTPVEGVRVVPPSTRISVDPAKRYPLRRSSSGAVSQWVSPRDHDPFSPEALEETADALVRLARSIGQAWPSGVSVDLSGGRDSRLTAAAFIAAGADVSFFTKATYEEEGRIAGRLTAAVGRSDRHEIVEPTTPPSTSGTIEKRARRHHAIHDGLGSASFLIYPASTAISARQKARVSGAAGELAHGHYYPRDISSLGVPPSGAQMALSLTRRFCSNPGWTEEGRRVLAAHLRLRVDEASALGLVDLEPLDYFYLLERQRRWSSASQSVGVLVPLCSPTFIRTSFDLELGDRLTSRLHKALIPHLIPEWAEVPFFQPTPDSFRASTRPKIWETDDRPVIEAILDDPSRWEDVFDAGVVRSLWQEALAGDGTASHEEVLQRVVWRATFEEHLDLVNDTARRADAVPRLDDQRELWRWDYRPDHPQWGSREDEAAAVPTDTAASRDGVRLKGSATAQQAYWRNLEARGPAGARLELQCWARGSALPEGGGLVAIQVALRDEDGAWERHVHPLPRGTYPWQPVRLTVRAEREFTRARVYVHLYEATGEVELDRVVLTADGTVVETTPTGSWRRRLRALRPSRWRVRRGDRRRR